MRSEVGLAQGHPKLRGPELQGLQALSGSHSCLAVNSWGGFPGGGGAAAGAFVIPSFTAGRGQGS